MSEFIYQPGTPLGDAERQADREREAAEHKRQIAEMEAAADERHKERLMERMRVAKFHSVTVTTKTDDEGTEDECRRVDRIEFVGTAPADEECRTYPESCGCESFEWNKARTHDMEGHPRTSGNECWMKDWFDAEGAMYDGDDQDDMRDDQVPAIDRSGDIIVSFVEEWIQWDWFTPTDAGSET